jgi:hypothetical protein
VLKSGVLKGSLRSEYDILCVLLVVLKYVMKFVCRGTLLDATAETPPMNPIGK